MDLENGEAYFVSSIDRAELIAQNYTVVEGKILDVPVSGHGKHNTTLGESPSLIYKSEIADYFFLPVGLELIYNTNIRLYEKGGERYLESYNFTTELNINRGYFYFENIYSSEKSEYNLIVMRLMIII